MESLTGLKQNTGGHSTGLYQTYECIVESVDDLTATEKLFRMTRRDGRPFGHKPGQFIQISIPGAGEAPISVSSSPTRGSYLEVGVRNAGKVTGLMHTLKKGDAIGIRGPFGTYFNTDAMQGRDLLLIAGGCGLAPMRALIQYVEDRRGDFGKVILLYGAKSPKDLLYKDELDVWQTSETLECHVTVDRVERGTCWDANVGLITSLIWPLPLDPVHTRAVIVGPPIMYKHVIFELAKKNLPDENITLSLERYMKCGVGKCGHCCIEHLYCCIDGPVFEFGRVKGLKGLL